MQTLCFLTALPKKAHKAQIATEMCNVIYLNMNIVVSLIAQCNVMQKVEFKI